MVLKRWPFLRANLRPRPVGCAAGSSRSACASLVPPPAAARARRHRRHRRRRRTPAAPPAHAAPLPAARGRAARGTRPASCRAVPPGRRGRAHGWATPRAISDACPTWAACLVVVEVSGPRRREVIADGARQAWDKGGHVGHLARQDDVVGLLAQQLRRGVLGMLPVEEGCVQLRPSRSVLLDVRGDQRHLLLVAVGDVDTRCPVPGKETKQAAAGAQLQDTAATEHAFTLPADDSRQHLRPDCRAATLRPAQQRLSDVVVLDSGLAVIGEQGEHMARHRLGGREHRRAPGRFRVPSCACADTHTQTHTHTCGRTSGLCARSPRPGSAKGRAGLSPRRVSYATVAGRRQSRVKKTFFASSNTLTAQ